MHRHPRVSSADESVVNFADDLASRTFRAAGAIQRAAIPAMMAAGLLLLHDYSWFTIGVVMLPTYILHNNVQWSIQRGNKIRFKLIF